MRDVHEHKQRGDRGQPPAAQWAATGAGLRRGSSPGACAAASRRPPGGALNAARGTGTTG